MEALLRTKSSCNSVSAVHCTVRVYAKLLNCRSLFWFRFLHMVPISGSAAH
jgi:hypothetical protein